MGFHYVVLCCVGWLLPGMSYFSFPTHTHTTCGRPSHWVPFDTRYADTRCSYFVHDDDVDSWYIFSAHHPTPPPPNSSHALHSFLDGLISVDANMPRHRKNIGFTEINDTPSTCTSFLFLRRRVFNGNNENSRGAAKKNAL